MPELSASAAPARLLRGGSPQHFSWDCEPDGLDSVRLRLAGELDLSDRRRLRRALIEAGERAATITVDLHEVTFIDCATIATLLDAAAEARRRGGELSLLGASGQVERVLELTGISADVGQLASATTARRAPTLCQGACEAPWPDGGPRRVSGEPPRVESK